MSYLSSDRLNIGNEVQKAVLGRFVLDQPAEKGHLVAQLAFALSKILFFLNLVRVNMNVLRIKIKLLRINMNVVRIDMN
jgi:hypothetical protein